jgi:hypothetical protein
MTTPGQALQIIVDTIKADGEPSQQQELAAIAAMVQYLIPQARTLSPHLTLLLNLALHEISLLRGLQDGSVVRLQS